MATLIAVDGHSLNFGLQKVAQTRNGARRARFRVDHHRLAELLAQPDSVETVSLRFYTDDQKLESTTERPTGRVVKYFANKGYGFISGTDGHSYFFHHNEVVNKKALCGNREDRYPHPLSQDFRDRIIGKVVTFNPLPNEDGRFKADGVTVELSEKAVDRYYQLRRMPFLQMLEDNGYKLVRCRQSHYPGKSKSIDCRITLDALCELESGDRFVLLSDDPVFIDLAEKLLARGIKITIATFKVSRSNEISEAIAKLGGQLVFLDEHLEDIQLEYPEDEAGSEDTTDLDSDTGFSEHPVVCDGA